MTTNDLAESMLFIIISSISKAPIICSLEYLLRIFNAPWPLTGAKIFLLWGVRTAGSTSFFLKKRTIVVEEFEMLFHFALQVFNFLRQTLFSSSCDLSLLHYFFRIVSVVYTYRSCAFVRNAARYTTRLEGHQIFFVTN